VSRSKSGGLTCHNSSQQQQGRAVLDSKRQRSAVHDARHWQGMMLPQAIYRDIKGEGGAVLCTTQRCTTHQVGGLCSGAAASHRLCCSNKRQAAAGAAAALIAARAGALGRCAPGQQACQCIIHPAIPAAVQQPPQHVAACLGGAC
jgi:hypothetical protein